MAIAHDIRVYDSHWSSSNARRWPACTIRPPILNRLKKGGINPTRRQYGVKQQCALTPGARDISRKAFVKKVGQGIDLGPGDSQPCRHGMPAASKQQAIIFGGQYRRAKINASDGAACSRSEERRVGKEWVSTCRSRWATYH